MFEVQGSKDMVFLREKFHMSSARKDKLNMSDTTYSHPSRLLEMYKEGCQLTSEDVGLLASDAALYL